MLRLRRVADAAAVPRPGRPAFLLASSARFGYGHLARSLKIARALAARGGLAVYVVSPLPDFETGRDDRDVRRVELPPFALRSATGPARWPITDVVSTLPGVPASRLRAHQGRLLAALIRQLRPVGILIDHYPFFLEEAYYRDGLAALRETSPRALVSSGFRGTASRPYAPAERRRLRALLDAHVDLLLVYVGRDERVRVLRRNPFLRGLRTPLRLTGYVCPPPGRTRARGRRPRILATFGSGVDAAPTIELVCEAFRHLARRHPACTLDVVAGGRLDPRLFACLERRYAHERRVRIIRFLPRLEARLGRYALVVGRGGYNTLTELYQSGTRGIVLPRVYPGNDEQRLLARRFRAAGGVDHVIDEARCRPARLARLMRETLARPPAPRRPLDTGGADRSAAIIRAELRRRGLLRP